jgi:hypothetical protein
MAAIPRVLDGLSPGDGSGAARGAVEASLAQALREAISEDDEQRLTDVCWELEESGEEENVALAKTLLSALGLR